MHRLSWLSPWAVVALFTILAASSVIGLTLAALIHATVPLVVIALNPGLVSYTLTSDLLPPWQSFLMLTALRFLRVAVGYEVGRIVVVRMPMKHSVTLVRVWWSRLIPRSAYVPYLLLSPSLITGTISGLARGRRKTVLLIGLASVAISQVIWFMAVALNRASIDQVVHTIRLASGLALLAVGIGLAVLAVYRWHKFFVYIGGVDEANRGD